MARRTLYGTVIVTYRCNARCNMCDCFKDPTKPEEEITLEDIKKLPEMAFTNITGGEPFVRQDIPEIVRELYKKSDRIVISTNGYFTDRIIALCKEFPKVGIRISIEGLQKTNDAIRGIPDGFNRGYQTLKTLVEMKHPDVGFGMTVQDMNCQDLVPLYNIANDMGMEFATATLHNSFYFRKILDGCRKFPKDRLFLLSLGVTAKFLAEDLYRDGYRVIDIGNLDMEYEWFLQNPNGDIPNRPWNQRDIICPHIGMH